MSNYTLSKIILSLRLIFQAQRVLVKHFSVLPFSLNNVNVIVFSLPPLEWQDRIQYHVRTYFSLTLNLIMLDSSHELDLKPTVSM